MSGSIEICVQRAGKWEVYNFYSSVDPAVEDAIGLKSQNAYPKIAVVNHGSKKIEYYFDKSGKPKLDYGKIQEGLKKAAEHTMNPSAKIKNPSTSTAMENGTPSLSTPDESPKIRNVVKHRPPEEVVRNKKVIAILSGGLIVSALLLFATGFDPMGIFMAISLVLLCGYYAHLIHAQEEDEVIEEMIEADTSPSVISDDRLVQVSSVLSTMVKRAKEVSWDEAEGKMKGDSHFGLLLYMVGAIRAYANYDQKKINLYYPILNHVLQSIGLDEQSVLRCCQNIEEFRLNSRFSNMFERGFVNTQNHLKDPEVRLGVRRAMELWKGVQDEDEEDEDAGMSAVLFTDIVSFTEQTEQKGEAWLTNVVMAHNKIVRDILKTYNGREVKHTGDGIMASFPSTASAVGAAVHMQRGFKYFSENKASLAFEVRIGICTGNPVKMDGDLFGNPVNMAARVMDFGDALDIIVAQSTYDVCQDENTSHEFEEVADVPLKGFEGNRSVYKVIWQEDLEGSEDSENSGKKNAEEKELSIQELAQKKASLD